MVIFLGVKGPVVLVLQFDWLSGLYMSDGDSETLSAGLYQYTSRWGQVYYECVVESFKNID